MFQHYGKITGCETIKGMSVFLPSSSLSTIQALPYELNAVYTSIHCPHSSYHLINGLLYCSPPPLWRRQLLKFWYLEKFLWQATAGHLSLCLCCLVAGTGEEQGSSGGEWRWLMAASSRWGAAHTGLGASQEIFRSRNRFCFGSSRARINFCRQSL